MKVAPATSVALLIISTAAMVNGCASQTNPAPTGGPSALMSIQQKQQAVENSNMSPQAKAAWEQAASRAGGYGPQVPKNPQ